MGSFYILHLVVEIWSVAARRIVPAFSIIYGRLVENYLENKQEGGGMLMGGYERRKIAISENKFA